MFFLMVEFSISGKLQCKIYVSWVAKLKVCALNR
jgi:hypothetical protein